MGWALGVTRSPIRTKPEREAEAAADSVLKGRNSDTKALSLAHQGTRSYTGGVPGSQQQLRTRVDLGHLKLTQT